MTTLGWGRSAVTLEGDPAVCDWVARFLAPPFVTTGERGRRATVRVDAAAFAALAAAPDDGTRVTAITLDEALVPLRVAPGGWAIDDEARLAMRRAADRAELLLAADTRLARVIAMRVVRELAARDALAAGDVPLHAAGIVAGGGARLFVGGKRAGKTTLLLAALLRGATLLANDRVYVEVDDGAAIARGMPTIVVPRPGTLELLPEIAPRLAGVPTPMGPGGLAAALGVPIAADAPVAAITFVERAETGFALRRLGAVEARERLARGGLVAGGAQAEMFRGGDATPRVDALLRRVPWFALALGADALRADALWRELT